MQREHVRALALCGLSLIHYALFYVISIVLARVLSIPDFNDYNVAVSTVLVLTSIATLGLEKYALRCLPSLEQNRDWSRTRGFLMFSSRRIFAASFALFLVLAGTLEITLALLGKNYHAAIVVAALFLPIISLFHFRLEVVTAYEGQLKAVAIYRFVFPAVFLTLVASVWASPLPSTAISAVGCYGLAWIISSYLLQILVRQHVPAVVWQTSPTQEPRLWLRGAIPLVVNSFLLTMLAQTGVIVLELLYPDQLVVSSYAVAFQTGTFVVVLATATNRLYAPSISRLLEIGDAQALNAVRKRRLIVILPLTLTFLMIIFVFGRAILAVFGPNFVIAYPAMCVIAGGASISTLFSLAPIYLQFQDRSRLVLSATTTTVLIGLVLCFALGTRFGALGAAIAYAMPITILSITLRLFATSDPSRYNGGRNSI